MQKKCENLLKICWLYSNGHKKKMKISQMKYLPTFVIIFIFALSSCSKLPTVQSFPASELSSLSDIKLCHKYYDTNRGNAFTEKSRNEIETELKSRGLMTDADLLLIRRYKVKIGSSRNVMFASLGQGISGSNLAKTHTKDSGAISEHYIFEKKRGIFLGRLVTFITIENGIVTKMDKYSVATGFPRAFQNDMRFNDARN